MQINQENTAQTTTNLAEKEIIQSCKNCGEPTIYKTFVKIFGKVFHRRNMCKCQLEREEFEKKIKFEYEKSKRIRELKQASFISQRYVNSTFENCERGNSSDFEVAFDKSKNYCDSYSTKLANGQGIYIYGDKGTSKTHLMSCLANFLIEKMQSTIFTNLTEIAKQIKSTFSKTSKLTEEEILEKFMNTKFLILDDIGKEIFTKNEAHTWLNSVLYDVVNTRYNKMLPTLFTSNYSPSELVNSRGIDEATIDRIIETSKIIRLQGKSRRLDNL